VCTIYYNDIYFVIASNGYQFEPSSLHYINNDSFRNLNRYEQGIWGVVNIVQEYDTDKLFPVWGFGAKLPPSYVKVNHAFNVNMSPDDPFCKETAGMCRFLILSFKF